MQLRLVTNIGQASLKGAELPLDDANRLAALPSQPVCAVQLAQPALAGSVRASPDNLLQSFPSGGHSRLR